MTEPYKEGSMHACFGGKGIQGIDDNPYTEGSSKHEEWQDGYLSIIKKNAYDDGRDAYFDGISSQDNPYYDDIQYEAWKDGWDDTAWFD